MVGYKYKKNNSKIQYDYISKLKAHESLQTNCQ